MTVFTLWSPPRARSTAFFRSMLERTDLVCVHEPFSDLAGLAETDVAGQPFTDPHELLEWLRAQPDDQHIFIKDTPNERLEALLAHRPFLARAVHAFLIRRPEEIAASFFARNPDMSADAIGLEFLRRLYDTIVDAGGRAVVIDSDDLVQQPHATMAAYCAAVGLEFVPDALTWEPGHRHEWRRSSRWHEDVARSSALHDRPQSYDTNTANSDALRSYAEHHRPFYEWFRDRKLPVTGTD